MKNIYRSSILIIGFILLTACTAMMPAQEMSDARQTLQAAKKVNADVIVPDAYKQAEALLEQATAELNQGDYTQARITALEARKLANHARQMAMTKKNIK